MESQRPLHHWRCLLVEGAAIGLLMGLVEICWTYFLPSIFPGRLYTLPTTTVGRFVLIAVVTDVLLAVLAAALLGLVIAVLGGIRPQWKTLRQWPLVIRLVLLGGAGSYLFVSYTYTYYFFNNFQAKARVAAVGAVVLCAASALIVWGLQAARRRFGRATLAIAWAVAVVVLVGMTIPKYLAYATANTFAGDYPRLTSAERPNVLLVTIDTCRADVLGCYGNDIVQTPTLDGLAADGQVFEWAFAHAPTTTPSHCSIMTSTYAARHEAVNGASMRTDLTTLAEILQFNGYDTGAFVSSTMVRSGNSGLHRGFDYFEDSISVWSSLFRNDECQFVVAFYLLAWLQDNQIPAYVVSDRSTEWLGRDRKNPFFCWLHYYDPHKPYDAPGPYKDMYAGKLRDDLPQLEDRIRYAGEVTYTDAQLGRVIATLKERNLYDDTLILVTADHGEAFGEAHDDLFEQGHGSHLYDTTQHVPLIVKLPGRTGAGRRIRDLVQLVDLAPTVLDWLGSGSPSSFQGQSLADLLRGRRRDTPGIVYAERMDLAGLGKADSGGGRRLMCIRTPNVKYICDDQRKRQEFYELGADPAERHNIILDRLDLADRMYESLAETLGKHATPTVSQIDPAMLKALRDLGYIGGAHDEDDGRTDDEDADPAEDRKEDDPAEDREEADLEVP